MIRPIYLSDAEAVRDLCDLALGYPVSLSLVQQQIQKLNQVGAYHLIAVYEDETSHQVLGFVHAQAYESFYCEAGVNILGLAVHPTAQGQGIGKALMTYLEETAQVQGFKFIRLNSGSQRQAAHQFYQAIGYHCDKTQKRFSKVLLKDEVSKA